MKSNLNRVLQEALDGLWNAKMMLIAVDFSKPDLTKKLDFVDAIDKISVEIRNLKKDLNSSIK